jgi:hypothetical protein
MPTEENRQIKDRIDRWLLSKVGKKNQNEPILKLVEGVLEKYKKERGKLNPPTDLNILGNCLDIKVKKILLSKNINSDALLIPTKGGFKVKLKNEDKLWNTYRTRYSLAHEMAHTFFYEMEEGNLPSRAVPEGSQYEERLCDLAAAEILMPKEIFELKTKKLVKKHGYSLIVLIKLNQIFKTSFESIGNRLIIDLKNGWEDYLLVKYGSIIENGETIKILGFEKEWQVPKNIRINLPERVYETDAIFGIFEDMKISPGEKISKYCYANDLYPGGINIKVILLKDLYPRDTSFFIMVPIHKYLERLGYPSDFGKYPKKEIVFDFNFEEKNSEREKMTIKKGKKDLVDFM